MLWGRSEIFSSSDITYGWIAFVDGDGSIDAMDFEWSLLQYRSMVEKEKQQKKAEEAWDELEKSVVANIADDVRVGVRGDIVEMTIIKRYDKKA